MRSKANLGSPLEELISRTCETYRQERIAIIEKVPTEFIPIRKDGKIVSAKVERKAPVDYMGNYQGRAIAFEAKYTDSDRIRLDEVQPHQREFLYAWHNTGGMAYILFGFAMKEFFFVPWHFYDATRTNWKEMRTRPGYFMPEDLREHKIGAGMIAFDFLATVPKRGER